MDIIIGTAGHIDHGKTALVRALTGVDADRLPEEKQRGITIDLGFAELDLGELKIGFVDVPGHERFVKNMLAGASGIDLVALVIAADSGVMPQTREHFDICRLLETRAGIIVITKSDLVDEELLEIVKLDAAELVENSFLENAPVVSISAKTGAGIDKLKTALQAIARQIPARKTETVARLPIDRSFTVRGFGAVVTGTLISGTISEGDELEILPRRKPARVRGVQTHGKTVKTARAGQRAAINLGGVDHQEIERGMMLAEADVLRPTQAFDAEIEVLKTAKKPLKSRQRVRVHLGTIEALARLRILNDVGEIPPGAKGLVQIRLETEIAAIPFERFILRSYSPSITVAGGLVLDNNAARHRRKDFAAARQNLENLIAADLKEDRAGQIKIFLETSAERGATFADLQARTGWRGEILETALAENISKKSVIETENFYVARTPFENLKTKIVDVIAAHHRREPLARGILRETLREKVSVHLAPEIFKTVLANLEAEGKISAEKDTIKVAAHSRELASDDKILFDKLEKIYREARLEVPTLNQALEESVRGTKSNKQHARKIFQLFLDASEIVKISDDFYFSRTALTALIEQLKSHAAQTADRLIDVPTFKDIAHISRKYAIPLLEYFDREKITSRAGDKRLIS